MEIAGVKPEHGILPVDISFRLGPRINASGRLADAALSVELFLSDDATFCSETARQLDAFNRERQDIERQITDDAERMVEEQFLKAPGIVLFNEAWHPGVVGIVAGRITRKYNRPTVVLGNENGLAKGSGRSVNGLSLVDVLASCSEQLNSWGGHPMAVGVSLTPERIAEFRENFCKAISKQTGGAIDDATLALSVWLTPEQVRDTLLDEISALHPFGQGNPEPIFGIRRVILRQRPEVFKGTHFRFSLDDAKGRRIFGVAWKMADRIPPVGRPIDLAVELGWNYFNDRKLLQAELIDWRLSPAEES
jgi:single-stranded-DNA-specific exonuclease